MAAAIDSNIVVSGTSIKRNFVIPPLFAMVVGVLMLGCGPLMVRLAEVSPIASAFWRLSLAVPPLLLVVGLSRESVRLLPRRLVGSMAAAGTVYGLGTMLMNASALETTLAHCALIGNFSSFLVAGIAIAATRRMPERAVSVALAMSVAGLALLLGPSAAVSGGAIGGDLLALAAAVLFTGYFLILGRVPLGARPMTLHAMSTTAGALVIAPFALGGAIVPGHWWPVLVLGLAQFLGQGLIVYSIPRLNPVLAGLCILLFPLANIALGWALYGEAMGGLQLAGALLIVLALAVLQLRGAGGPQRPR
jgi:drug/metabolite transporter (DMT)-like permease